MAMAVPRPVSFTRVLRLRHIATLGIRAGIGVPVFETLRPVIVAVFGSGRGISTTTAVVLLGGYVTASTFC
jgi:hypothetical protein